MKKLFLIALFFVYGILNGQKYLVLQNGDKFEYKSVEIENGSVIVKTLDKSSKSFSLDEVFGKCEEQLINITSEKFDFFSRPQFVWNYYRSHFIAGMPSKPYVSFFDRGWVNVIAFEYVESLYQKPAPILTDYYAIKDGAVYDLNITKGKIIMGRQKAERRDVLLKLIGDVPEFSLQLRDSTQKIDADDALEMIHQYNISTFSPSLNYTKPTTVFLFSSPVQAKGVKMEVSINDRAPIQISKTGVVPIQVDAIQLSKVCVRTDQFYSCELMRGSSCSFTYFEIKQKESRNRIEINPVTQKEWDFFQRSRFDK